MDTLLPTEEPKEMALSREVEPHTTPPVDVAAHPFAGRLGGNQRFALPPSSPSQEQLNPDSYRDPPWSAILSLHGFRSPSLYKLAFIEGVGTFLQTFISGLVGVGLVPTVTETSLGPVATVAIAALAQWPLISLFIYAAGPVTGAHFNPLITIGAFCARLSSLPRTVLYVLFQILGAVVGAFMLRAVLQLSPAELVIVPGCFIDTSLVSSGSA